MMTLMVSKQSCTRYPANVRRIVCVAALGSLSGSSWGFVLPPPVPAAAPPAARRAVALPPPRPRPRHLSSRGDDDDWRTFKSAGGNLVKRGARKIKSLLPFGKKTEEEQRQEKITGGISEALKGMPLPVRMLGRMVAPLLSRAAEQMAEQSQQAEAMLEEARRRLTSDLDLTELLGEPLRVGPPFAQSSSTTVINGQRSARLQAQFQVVGTRQSGVATLETNNGEIRSLTVNVNGRTISVDSCGSKNIYGNFSGKKGDDYIEAEIIEKKK